MGVAFTNRDGSINLFLDALPLGTNRLQVREPGSGGVARRRTGRRPPRDFETVEVRP